MTQAKPTQVSLGERLNVFGVQSRYSGGLQFPELLRLHRADVLGLQSGNVAGRQSTKLRRYESTYRGGP
ncbi:MAG: hypothetical protein CMH40_06130 [Micrococcales bacterium]|nr:hypothetical protein [Micrococcales bacterium]MAK39397.1 hypothetical protein [Micrococcales bacterium]